jgi:tetratricopeptide (TPR) repeat protein
MSLYDRFPDNPFEILARPYILRFIELNIDEAVAKAANGDYEAALGELFQISRYPIANDERINREISNIYQEQAELLVQEQNYLEADRYFRKAIQYFPAKQASIEMRLREIASLYIEKGNSYLQIKDFDNALVYYRKTFEIIPDYALALSAIERVKTTQNNIKRAAELALEAEKLESAKKYADAQRLFQQAYQLDNLDAYRQNAITMGNLIEAERSPLVFAQKIIKDYKNGILTNRINAQKQALLKTYKADEIRDSGWKILLSPGQYKYEARYDLITPRDNIFFVWQVNLKDRSITPLNKMSEKLMQ